jgi:hypothetical protein
VNLKAIVIVGLLASTSTGCMQDRRAAAPVRAAARAAQREADLLDTPSNVLANPQDAVVRVVGPQMTCTGTLIAEDLVLTAHHCVVQRSGREFTREVVPAARVNVELGGDYLAWGRLGLRAIVTPPCGEAGGRGDIAVLVLERKLLGMHTFEPRLGGPPRKGEAVEPMGFGRCALSAEGIRRRSREGGTIIAMSSGTFDMTASICPGDSGGPLIARPAGGPVEVIGVVSLSAMDADEGTRALSVMARIDAFRSVFVQARLIADGADPGDMPPLTCD